MKIVKNFIEAKFDGNAGVLEKKHVPADGVVYIGQEANRIDEQELDVKQAQVFVNEEEINGSLGFGFKLWHLIYLIIALVHSIHLIRQLFINGFVATIVLIISHIPMFLLDSLRFKRTAKNQNVERYKREFEEHIRMKEK